MAQNKSNGYGIASLVLGIISIILCWAPLVGLVSGILGIIFYAKQKRISPSGLAVGGLVTSIIGLVFSIIYTIMWIIAAITIGTIAWQF
jgi:hypothetical protein